MEMGVGGGKWEVGSGKWGREVGEAQSIQAKLRV